MTTCGGCNSGSAEATICCEICDAIFCIPCSKLVPTELKFIQLKSPATLMFCCTSCKTNVKKPTTVTIKFLSDQIKLLTDTIRDKETIISDKTRIIAHLEEKIVEQAKPKRQEAPPSKFKFASAGASTAPAAPNTTTPIAETSNPDNASQSSNVKVMEARQRAAMNRVINLGKDGSGSAAPQVDIRLHKKSIQPAKTDTDAPWTTVSYNKRGRNRTTLGANTGELTIAAVESRRSIFVSRLSPDTTPEMLKQHLEASEVKPLSIEKLVIKSEEIAAFKVVVQQSDEKRATSSEVWPRYTIIRPYRQPRVFLGGRSQAIQSS